MLPLCSTRGVSYDKALDLHRRYGTVLEGSAIKQQFTADASNRQISPTMKKPDQQHASAAVNALLLAALIGFGSAVCHGGTGLTGDFKDGPQPGYIHAGITNVDNDAKSIGRPAESRAAVGCLLG